MKKENLDYTLYLCTDRGLMSTDTLEKAVEEAILGGVTMVQLREKDCSSREFYETALRIKKITDAYEVPLLINDRVDIALAVDADGVHIGQSDLPVKIARKILGKDKIIGVSARNVAQALEAEQNGADYLGVGAMYATGTKKDAKVTSREELLKIRQAVKIPIVVIGGINQKTLSNFKGIGINGLAVVSAVIAAKDIKAAAAGMVRKFKE